MLANADAAKATHFTVVLDKSTYSTTNLTTNLLHADMHSMQGPGLLVGNNAVCSEQDFAGYTRKIGDSIKKNDKGTIGQFGRGALTAYSLADEVQLLTGEDIMFLDPHEARLPNKAPSLRGNLVDPHNKHYVDIQQQASCQMQPFLSATSACPSLPALSVGTHYPGTLFRLAFRTPQTAATSLISKESITADKFQANTLKDFCSIAPDLLIFTRHVHTISVYVQDSADSSAGMLHECTRQLSPFDTAHSELRVQQLTTRMQQGSQAAATCKMWAVATSVGSEGECNGVAALLHEGPATTSPAQWELPEIMGKVYATMPLPFETSKLPVHINGAFLVQADRRKMWSGEGDEGKVGSSY